MRPATRLAALTLLLLLLPGCAGATVDSATPTEAPMATISPVTRTGNASPALIQPAPATPTSPPPPTTAVRTPALAASAAPLNPAFACPATRPNGSAPPGERPASTYHGNGALWVALWPEGTVIIPTDPAKPSGALAMKFPWWRGPGVRGSLTIVGRRLDAPAPPLAADIPGGYGDTGFQSTGLLFPTEGCWEVTGRAGDASLVFVALVVRADPSPATPPAITPTARSQGSTPIPSPRPALPAGCDEDTILRIVQDFIAAFNRGDQAGRARVFPARGSDPDHPWTGDPDQLRWFTLVRADPGKGVNALNLYTREAVLAYFAERHAQHEQMRVVELTVNPAGGFPGAVAINFRIARAADDLPEAIFPGKGGVSCAHDVIFLWSQGGGPFPSSP